MDQISYNYWRKVYADFRNSGLSVEKFCQQKHLNSRWFERQRREAEVYEQRSEQKASSLHESEPDRIPIPPENLFVELIPEQSSPLIPPTDAPVLRLSYREVKL